MTRKTIGKPKITIVSTGNELLSGDILDTNAAFIAKELTLLGLPVQQKLTLGDQKEHLSHAFRLLSKAMDLVIVSGGLGGTVDDLTCGCISEVSGVPLVQQDRAVKHVEGLLLKGHRKLDEAHLKQCNLPEGSDLFDNRVGLAMGFALVIDKARFYFMPGVPKEMEIMFIEEVLPDITKHFQIKQAQVMLRFHIFGLGESQVQKILLKQVSPEKLNQVDLGFRATSPFVELKFAMKESTSPELMRALEPEIVNLLGDTIFSREKSFAEAFVQLLKDKKKTLALAESCTGGLISSLITSVPGASEVLLAGLVTYSNAAKIRFLDVPSQVIKEYGAVSEETAANMLLGTLENTGSDYGLAITGIAGPSGGTEDKPVGTVIIAFGDQSELFIQRFLIPRPRKTFQRFTAYAALDLLRRFILKLPIDCHYFFDDLSKPFKY